MVNCGVTPGPTDKRKILRATVYVFKNRLKVLAASTAHRKVRIVGAAVR